MLKMITERKVPCRVHPGVSAVCRQWHKLKPETNLVASLTSRDVCLRSTLLSTLQLHCGTENFLWLLKIVEIYFNKKKRLSVFISIYLEQLISLKKTLASLLQRAFTGIS